MCSISEAGELCPLGFTLSDQPQKSKERRTGNLLASSFSIGSTHNHHFPYSSAIMHCCFHVTGRETFRRRKVDVGSLTCATIVEQKSLVLDVLTKLTLHLAV